jgi:hypothetical protein
MEITDPRTVVEFQKKTFCGHPRAHVRKVLLQNVQLGHADYACYWTLELLCSGLVHSLWDAFFEAAALHINRANPAIFTFLATTYETYVPLEGRYSIQNMTDIRNNIDVRRMVCEVAAILSTCRKNKLPTLPTLKPQHDFDPVTIQESIKAPSSMYGKAVLRPSDPMSVVVPINEFCYCIRSDVRDLTRALYWMSWVLTFCREHKKASKMVLPFANRSDDFVPAEVGSHPIWIFWDAVRKQAGILARPYIETMYKMHCLRWSPSDKSKRPLLIAAIVLVCESSLDTTPVAPTIATSQLLEGMPKWIDAIQRMQQSFAS